MGLLLHQVDAFTPVPFRGNPAAVLILEKPVSDSFMQLVAAEMNLSETAFVQVKDGPFGLRWFTPRAEVDLCGHATLASAHVLWETGRVDPADPIRFDTLSGTLEVTRTRDRLEMDFPSEPAEAIAITEAVRAAVSADVVEAGMNRLDYLVVLQSEEAVRNLQPDLDAVARLGSRGMIVTAGAHGSDYDFVSRYFAPQFGIPEDPVTGSTHCCLGPYWGHRLGRNDLTGFQASARGGFVFVTNRGDRVTIGGHAVSTARIELLTPPEE